MTGPSYAHPDDDRPGTTTPPDQTDGPYEPAAPTPTPQLERTRTGAVWVASIAAVLVLLLLLIFILQNGARVTIQFFGADPTLPLGVALLLAAVLGALLVALVGVARVVQLRHTAKRMARTPR
jgi:uncharacterized integral membrane protein